MKLIEVTDRKTRKEFLQVPKILYKNDPFWVCQLDREINAAFNPKENVYLKNGEAIRWVLKNDQNRLIGRIAAFYNKVTSMAETPPSGGIGWFECIDDRQAASIMFDAARDWLQERGLEAMDGPINFGETESNWGLLVEGFSNPGYGMTYHFPYYKDLFEDYGFQVYFKQYSYHLDIKKPFPERFWKIADWIAKKPDYHFRHFTFKDQEKFIDDMVYIYNEAWKDFKENFTPLQREKVQEGLKAARPIIDPEIIWFAYHKEEPVGFYIMFPDVNQILKHLDGRMTPWNMLRFLLMKKRKKMTRIRATVAGIVPKFRNSGIESAIFRQLSKVMEHRPHYREIELSWVGDFNPRMRAIYEAVGGELAKIHHTYRYLFDRNAKFVRFMPEAFEKEKKMEQKKKVQQEIKT